MRLLLTLVLAASLTLAEGEGRPDGNGDPLPTGAVARFGSARFALPYGAREIAWAPDGRSVAVAVGLEVRLYDASDGRETLRLAGHTESVGEIAFSIDGRSLESVAADKTLRTWSLEDGRETGRLDLGKDGWVETIAPGGRILQCAYGEPPCLRKGTDEIAIPTEASPQWAAFSPDGRVVGGVDGDGDAWWADVASGQLLGRASGVHGRGESLRLLPGRDEVVLASGQSAICAYRASTGAFAWWAECPLVAQTVACSSDGRVIAVSGLERAIVLLAPETGATLGELVVAGPVARMAFSPDSKRLAVAFSDWGLTVLEVATGKPATNVVGHRGPVGALAVRSDGSTIATGGSDGTVRIWDAATGEERQRIEVDDEVRSLSFSPKGDALAVCGVACGMTIHGYKDGWVTGAKEDWASAVYSSDGSRIAAAGYLSIVALLGADGAVEHRLSRSESSGFHRAVALSPDGSRVAFVEDCSPFAIEVLDTSTFDRVGRVFGEEPVVWSLALSPDGRCVAYGGDGATVNVWEVGEAQGRFRFDALAGPVASVAWSADGRWIAAGDESGRVTLYDLLGGRALPFDAGSGPVRCVAFSADGARVYSGHGDGTALAWEVPASSPRVGASVGDLWSDLASGDPALSIPAVWALAAHGDEAVAQLDRWLTSEDPAVARARALVPKLDSDEFEEREEASKGLYELGPSSLPALDEALRAHPSPETEGRIRELIAAIGPSGLPLRAARATHALRLMRTPAAVELLRKLGQGPR